MSKRCSSTVFYSAQAFSTDEAVIFEGFMLEVIGTGDPLLYRLAFIISPLKSQLLKAFGRSKTLWKDIFSICLSKLAMMWQCYL